MIREIRIKDLIKYFCAPIAIISLMWVLFAIYSDIIPYLLIKIAVILILASLSAVLLKPFTIGIILMYKAFAPKKMRDRCRFEPTCSTYMIMAINKYGLIRGVVKGIKRILRCKPPNGGIDYP